MSHGPNFWRCYVGISNHHGQHSIAYLLLCSAVCTGVLQDWHCLVVHVKLCQACTNVVCSPRAMLVQVLHTVIVVQLFVTQRCQTEFEVAAAAPTPNYLRFCHIPAEILALGGTRFAKQERCQLHSIDSGPGALQLNIPPNGALAVCCTALLKLSD